MANTIKIVATTNKTITVTETETNTKFIILGADVELLVYDESNIYMTEFMKKRTCTLFNKYNRHIIAQVNATTLDPASSGYTTDMDVYALYLRDSVLFI